MRITCALLLSAAMAWTSAARAADPAAPQRAAPAEAAADHSVLLLPFQPIGDADVMPWLGQAIQQNVVNELSRGTGLAPLMPPKDAPAAADADAARKAADAQGARFVLYGAFHAAGRDLRITGQVLDVKAGKHVGGVKATGSTRELFLLEDTIATQARRILLAQVPAAAPPGPPAADPVARANDDVPAPGEFPWDKDRYAIQDARDQLVLDRYNYTASYDRWRYYPNDYGFYGGYGYYGYYPWFIGHHFRHRRHHHHHHRHGTTFGRYRGGLTYFPGGVAVGRLRAIPGGVINVGHW
jgi:TolB-like protein